MKRTWLNRWYWVMITAILLFSFILRLPNINRPLLDAHYFRQTQTATIARNFYLSGIDFFHTKLDIFGDSKEQVLLLEFPLYQGIVAFISYFSGFHDYIGRLISLIFAVASGVLLALLTNKLFTNKYIGIIALVFFLFNPLNYYFHQAYMIESTVIFLHLLSIYLWLKYAEVRSNNWLIAASLATAIVFIHKNIYAPFLLLPIIAFLFFKLGKQEFKKFHWLPAILFSIFILLAWQYYVNFTNFQNGHSNFTLTDTTQQLWHFGTLNDRFDVKGWISKLNFIQNSVTKFQWPVFLIGIFLLIRKKEKGKSVLSIWLLAMVFYYLLLFRIQSHDYYFMLVLPIFSIIAAFGLSEVAKSVTDKFLAKTTAKYLYIFTISIYLSLFAYKSIQNAKMYFKIDENMLVKLNTYENAIKNPGNILFIFEQYDWNSVYTYFIGHKGIVMAAKDLSPEVLKQYSTLGYKYAVIDGTTSLSEVRKNYSDIFSKYTRLLSEDDVVILGI